MIISIALGILLGYILIQLLPSILIFIGGIFRELGSFTSKFFNLLFNFGQIIYNLWKKFIELKWYYKLFIFVGLFYIFASLNLIICLLILIIIYSYSVGKFIVKYIDKFNDYSYIPSQTDWGYEHYKKYKKKK